MKVSCILVVFPSSEKEYKYFSPIFVDVGEKVVVETIDTYSVATVSSVVYTDIDISRISYWATKFVVYRINPNITKILHNIKDKVDELQKA